MLKISKLWIISKNFQNHRDVTKKFETSGYKIMVIIVIIIKLIVIIIIISIIVIKF